jgi:flagellar protein FlaG
MNSEITNVTKLVLPVVLKPKQADVKTASGSGTEGQVKVAAEQKQAAKETSLETVRSAAAAGNSIFQATNRNLEFQVDDSTKRVVVKIVDSKNGDVVQQIPSEDMLAFIKRMQDLEGNQGTMLQDRA